MPVAVEDRNVEKLSASAQSCFAMYGQEPSHDMQMSAATKRNVTLVRSILLQKFLNESYKQKFVITIK